MPSVLRWRLRDLNFLPSSRQIRKSALRDFLIDTAGMSDLTSPPLGRAGLLDTSRSVFYRGLGGPSRQNTPSGNLWHSLLAGRLLFDNIQEQIDGATLPDMSPLSSIVCRAVRFREDPAYVTLEADDASLSRYVCPSHVCGGCYGG